MVSLVKDNESRCMIDGCTNVVKWSDHDWYNSENTVGLFGLYYCDMAETCYPDPSYANFNNTHPYDEDPCKCESDTDPCMHESCYIPVVCKDCRIKEFDIDASEESKFIKHYGGVEE